MENNIKSCIIQHSEQLFGTAINEKQIQFQKTRKDVAGDLTLIVFPFVKMLKCSPIEAGEKLGQFLKDQVAEITNYEVINGFLNLFLHDVYWSHQMKQIHLNESYGYATQNSKSTVMVEYSSPNTNKPLHLGHLRNNFLGYSVAEILKANGHQVIKTQIINDRGIHICKSMLAWLKFSPINELGERETPSNTGIKGDKLVGKYYVEFDKHFNAEANAIIADWKQGNFEHFAEKTVAEFVKLNDAKEDKDEKTIKGLDAKIKDLAKNETTILQEAKEMLLKWEAKDSEVVALWQKMNQWVYDGFEKTYKEMGVDFDKLYYESNTFLLGKDVVLEGLEKGVFYRKEDGSVWIDLTKDGMDEKLVLRSDGTSVYMTQDIGTAIERFKDFPDLNGIVYTVGNEQDYHFKVLFLILQKLAYSWANNCFHLSYGMVDLPDGKMKSREGNVVDADDLMEEVVQHATEMTQERGHLEGMSQADLNQLYRMIGIGGLKYYLLKVDPKKRMKFNPAESIELNGNTAPFIQYTHARIQSLLAKYNQEIEAIIPNELHELEKELIKQMLDFPSVIETAAQEYSPALIANYTYELVKSYNHFYQSVTILNSDDEQQKIFRLMLSKNVGKIIKNAMSVLGIEVPNRM